MSWNIESAQFIWYTVVDLCHWHGQCWDWGSSKLPRRLCLHILLKQSDAEKKQQQQQQHFCVEFLQEVWLFVHWTRYNIFAKTVSALPAVHGRRHFWPKLATLFTSDLHSFHGLCINDCFREVSSSWERSVPVLWLHSLRVDMRN